MHWVCKRIEGSKSTLISHKSTESTESTDLNIYAMENAKSTSSWYEIVEHFSSLKLVFSKDRLPAIAASYNEYTGRTWRESKISSRTIKDYNHIGSAVVYRWI
jgi:hypothetical protein